MRTAHSPKHDMSMHTDGPYGLSPHDNTFHTHTYVATLTLQASFYNPSDQFVDATGPVTVAGVGPTISDGFSGWLIPIGCPLNFRPGSITVVSVMDIWLEVNGVQRTAKYPITVDPALSNKLFVNLPIVSRGVPFLDFSFWAAQKSAGTYNITVRAQRRPSADAPTANIIVSDVGPSILVVMADVA